MQQTDTHKPTQIDNAHTHRQHIHKYNTYTKQLQILQIKMNKHTNNTQHTQEYTKQKQTYTHLHTI